MRRLKRRGPSPVEMSPMDSMDLLIGPSPRVYVRPEWPQERARLEALWRQFGHLLTALGPPEPWGAREFDKEKRP